MQKTLHAAVRVPHGKEISFLLLERGWGVVISGHMGLCGGEALNVYCSG